jgi:hypothetical protein
MPVNFLHLKDQIVRMGEQARAQESGLSLLLQRYSSLLEERASDIMAWQRIVDEALSRNNNLRCAVPVNEPLNAHIPVHLPAHACHILSADGSQINPDPHDTVLYGLVNIGIFHIEPGSGRIPSEHTRSSLIFGEDLYPAAGTISEDLIALRRDVLERQALAELSADLPSPVITLTDGPLELYHEPRQDQVFRPYFNQYLRALEDLALQGAITAGYVSRPRADLVVQCFPTPQSRSANVSRQKATTMVLPICLSSLPVCTRLAVGRSFGCSHAEAKTHETKNVALFLSQCRCDHFPAFARVEIPQWVVENPSQVQALQAVLVEQARFGGSAPYPNPLIRAHEIAVVKMEDRQQVTTLIEKELLRQGFSPSRPSEKQVHKNYSGRKRLNR